ncbi:MAG: hypothetical protein LBJ46_00165 [Planctomycetota bacterium]|jgi:hypothetical protein|nr:hypothetical protein [Planctomycetota bacterium]
MHKAVLFLSLFAVAFAGASGTTPSAEHGGETPPRRDAGDYYEAGDGRMPRPLSELPEQDMDASRTGRPEDARLASAGIPAGKGGRESKRRNDRAFPAFRERAEVEASFPEDEGPAHSEPLSRADPDPAEQALESAPAPFAPPPPAQPEMPTPSGVEDYRLRLEERLLERYNNLPDFAGRVGLVQVLLSRPVETSIDGRFLRAEFDQLVYDIWGKRLPALEAEYFVVTFGAGGAQQVRSEPSVRVGLDLKGAYSEMAPPISRPLESIDPDEAFSGEPKVEMPPWWRPEFPELY